MLDRRHVARMAGVIEVITYATGRDILALLWAWRSGANPWYARPWDTYRAHSVR